MNFNVSEEKQTKESLMNYIEENFKATLAELGIKVEEDSYKKIFYYLYRDFIGLNEIEPLLRDYFIEDIECNGAGEPIYIVHRVFRNVGSKLKSLE